MKISMHSFKKSPLILILCILLGCSDAQDNFVKKPDLSFDKLKLEQRNKQGIKTWDITTEHASLDDNNKLVRALRPYIRIYVDQEIRYILTSDKLIQSVKGDFLLLEGNALIKSDVEDEKVKFNADTIKWYPDTAIIALEINPNITYKASTIRTQKIEMETSTSNIRLIGDTSIYHEEGNRKVQLSGKDINYDKDAETISSKNKISINYINSNNEKIKVLSNGFILKLLNKLVYLNNCDVRNSDLSLTRSNKCIFDYEKDDMSYFSTTPKKKKNHPKRVRTYISL